MVKGMHKRNLFTFNFNKKFYLIFKIFILVSILLIFFYNISGQYQENYNASLIDKVKRLNSINEPKIVLLGNSNLAFGIDSRLIEEELEMSVVNMGLHGGLGNAFHEEMAKINVTKGDIYVLCHTSYNSPNKIENLELCWITLENNFELYQILRYEDIWPMIKAYPVYLKKCINLLTTDIPESTNIDSVYSRKAFNIYGDVSIERTKNKYDFSRELSVPSIDIETAERINKLAEWLNSKEATLVVAGYPIADGNMTPAKKEYEKFQLELENLLECDVISNFTDYMFDYKYFYDSEYHLTTDGVKLRTDQLIEDLKRWRL